MDVYITRAHNIDNVSYVESIQCTDFEIIYNQYYKNVYNYISFRINNHHDSEELVSLVFENVIRKFHTYNSKLPMEAWLIGIAKNVVSDYFRSKKRKIFMPLESILELVSPNRQPEEVVVFNEDNKSLIEAMNKLKDAERQILSMKFATDLKNNDIAKLLNISESNVAVKIHRAIIKLRKILGEESLNEG